MTIKSCSQGHELEFDFDKDQWIYSDTKESVAIVRECVKCGCKPTEKGYDSCIGFLKGVNSACCGHGTDKPFAVLKTGKHLEFDSIEEMRSYFK